MPNAQCLFPAALDSRDPVAYYVACKSCAYQRQGVRPSRVAGPKRFKEEFHVATAQLKFDEGHTWVRLDDDSGAVVGISDFAQDNMGEVIFIELPEAGAQVLRGDACGSLESVKSVEDLLAPVSGEVIAVNDDALDAPESVNDDPYGEGWLFSVKLDDPGELDKLMSASEYEVHLDTLDGDDDQDDAF